jgi:hypothetical protein
MRVRTAKNLSLGVASDSDTTRQVSLECSFGWRSALWGNLPIGAALGPALGGIYFGVALATDILTASAYDCPERWTLRLSAAEAALARSSAGPAKKACRVILVAPPYHVSRSTSEQIFRQWRAAVQPYLGPCDTVLPLSETRETAADLSLTFDRPPVLRNIPRSTLNRAALRTGSTHVAIIEVTSDDTRPQLVTTIHEIHGEDREVLKPIRVPVLGETSFYKPALLLVDQSFFVLPGSLAMASLFAAPDFDQRRASYKFYRQEESRDWKALASNWELTYVPRPSAFPVMDFKFVSALSLWSQLLQRRMSMYWRYSNRQPSDDLFTFKDQLNLWYLGLSAENRMYLMLGGYGAPFLGAGLGYALVSGELQGASDTSIKPFMSGYVGYVVETGRPAFFEVQGGFATTVTPHYQSRFTALSDFYFLRIKAGFFLDRFRDTIRSKF